MITMNKRVYAALIAASLFSLSACNENEPDRDESIVTPLKENSTPTNSSATTVSTDSSLTTAPGQAITVPAASAAGTEAGVVTAGMNPAHGQPGHRCEIAVGAPLNSAPAAKPATTTPTNTTTQTITPTMTKTATPTATAPGMNPAHGQPGHRCDIAVGASLNSPVAPKPAANTTPVVAPTTLPGDRKIEQLKSASEKVPAPLTPVQAPDPNKKD